MKLMLVDDHPLFLDGLKYLLCTYGLDVVGMASDGESAMETAKTLCPEVILMDIRMPGCGGIVATKQIKEGMPDVRIVMLTTSDEDEDLFEAIKCGADGYLLKNISAEELLAMLTDLGNGGVPISPGLALRTLQEFRSADRLETPTSGKETLTERQLEILELVSKGNTYKETGKILGISERTVKYHMGRILDLLHYESRSQAIAYAARSGLTEGS